MTRAPDPCAPEPSAAHLRGAATNAGANYFIAQFSFGELSQQEVLHSAGIFARKVLPASRERVARAV